MPGSINSRESTDPLAVLPPLASSLILSFLEPRELARACAVSVSWRDKASRDVGALWSSHCEALWAGKVWVAPSIRTLASTRPLAAYGQSLADSHRDVPTEAELCGFTWNLAFKVGGAAAHLLLPGGIVEGGSRGAGGRKGGRESVRAGVGGCRVHQPARINCRAARGWGAAYKPDGARPTSHHQVAPLILPPPPSTCSSSLGSQPPWAH